MTKLLLYFNQKLNFVMYLTIYTTFVFFTIIINNLIILRSLFFNSAIINRL